MRTIELLEALLPKLIAAAKGNDRTEVPDHELVSYIQEFVPDINEAKEAWQNVSPFLRRPLLRNGFVFQWNFFRSVVWVIRLPPAEQLQTSGELYQATTPQEVTRRIRSLTGKQFERFLGAVLTSMPEFRNVQLTKASHDEGVDIRGLYVPSGLGPAFSLIGQAKQLVDPITASTARDFIGAIDTAGVVAPLGLFVSTGGFTQPAIVTFQKTRFPIIYWDMDQIVEHSKNVATQSIDISFIVPHETFWDEVIGRPETV